MKSGTVTSKRGYYKRLKIIFQTKKMMFYEKMQIYRKNWKTTKFTEIISATTGNFTECRTILNFYIFYILCICALCVCV